ncbi:MAG: hypothetical protein NZM35_02725 [Chitinophagales bacterium]|nr:hypothetical protein [Chitinophagales bacterium]MDW8418103.1 glycoside hydrolase family 31 protein [Chitinophagales bacterium]
MKKLLASFAAVLIVIVYITSCKKKDNDDIPDPCPTPPCDTPYVQNTPWPKWVFQHWVWEDEGTTASARALVDDYLAHNIPVAAIVIDSPWETCYNTFEWDSTLYPNAKQMIDYFHSKNIKVLMWITGVINVDCQPLYDYAKSHNYFLKNSANDPNPKVVSWWKGDGSLIDFHNPQAVAWWKGLMDKVLDMGIDGWKCDGADFYAFPQAYSPGKGGMVTRLEHSHAYYRLFHDYTRQKRGISTAIMSRPIDNYNLGDFGGDLAAFSPKDIGWSCWVGDQDATFAGLKAALNNMYWSSVYPYLIFGSDIGGYREDNSSPPHFRTKRLFIRWAQLGAFSGLMENGGGGEHRPWMFDAQTDDIYRKLVVMREKYLVGYLLEQSVAANNAGKSLMTFLDKSKYSYLLGTDIFVTPILDDFGTVTINFPAGNDKWVYLYDKTKVYDGGTSITKTFPIDEFPVFVRQGTPLANVITP